MSKYEWTNNVFDINCGRLKILDRVEENKTNRLNWQSKLAVKFSKINIHKKGLFCINSRIALLLVTWVFLHIYWVTNIWISKYDRHWCRVYSFFSIYASMPPPSPFNQKLRCRWQWISKVSLLLIRHNLPVYQTNVPSVCFTDSTNQSPCESNKQKARKCENKNCCKTIKSCIIGSALHHTQQEAAFSIAHPFTFRLEVLSNWCVLPAYFVHFEVEIRRIRYKMWTFPGHIIKLKESLSKESPKVQNISFFLFPDI